MRYQSNSLQAETECCVETDWQLLACFLLRTLCGIPVKGGVCMLSMRGCSADWRPCSMKHDLAAAAGVRPHPVHIELSGTQPSVVNVPHQQLPTALGPTQQRGLQSSKAQAACTWPLLRQRAELLARWVAAQQHLARGTASTHTRSTVG